jgi:hypothetical protein
MTDYYALGRWMPTVCSFERSRCACFAGGYGYGYGFLWFLNTLEDVIAEGKVAEEQINVRVGVCAGNKV